MDNKRYDKPIDQWPRFMISRAQGMVWIYRRYGQGIGFTSWWRWLRLWPLPFKMVRRPR